jgi:collagenase-like PrtC family protease
MRFSEHEQITDFETLQALVKEIHKYGLEIFMNLNSRYYTDEVMPLIEQMFAEFEEIGVDGIICGNIGILEYLKKV